MNLGSSGILQDDALIAVFQEEATTLCRLLLQECMRRFDRVELNECLIAVRKDENSCGNGANSLAEESEKISLAGVGWEAANVKDFGCSAVGRLVHRG